MHKSTIFLTLIFTLLYRLTSNSWLQKSADKTADELTQVMSKLNMNAKPPAKTVKNTDDDEIPCFNLYDGFDSHESHSHSGPYVPRESLEHHSSSADLNAQMHGATPIPPRLSRRPPRLSLQSMSSRITISTNMNMDSQSPFVMNYTMSKPTHINTQISCMNTSEFVLT